MAKHQAQHDTEALDPGMQPFLGQPVVDGRLRPPGAAKRRHHGSVSWLTILGILFLTFNSGMAIYRSQGERWAIAYVVVSYLDLLMLFFSLRWYESAEPGSLIRDRLKVVTWVLTTALTLLFTTKVAVVMPTVVAVVVWLMAFTTIGGGFYAFFCYSEKE
ncbi:unnamed protein product [Miscanthus lutarioriparius]|uniref:Uncharacterized protein n=1 Tax=Miscanthus lutarioriparius TaxID=422564 RepID=A0A811PY44_9POAL|nr:unnamed protein product [Miscanthus lutarioriparius]